MQKKIPPRAARGEARGVAQGAARRVARINRRQPDPNLPTLVANMQRQLEAQEREMRRLHTEL